MTQILIEQNPSPMKLDVMHVEDWDVWEQEVCILPWRYTQTETCFITQGEAVITPQNGDPVTVSAGDLVTFMAGLSCTWEIRRPIRKHYRLG